MLNEQEQPEVEQEESAPIPPEEFVRFVTGSMNLAAEMEEGQLQEIARQVIDDYQMDCESMSDWKDQMKRAIDLAKLIKTDKTYPHALAANIKYPLITSAALQFNARAYPAIVPSQALVKSKVHGKDPRGVKAARGERVADYMSYQLTAEIEEWEEDTDSLLVQLPIVGTMVRKVWNDPVEGRPKCRLLEPGSFVVNNKVKSLEAAPRCSEELPLYPAEIETRIRSRQFVAFEFEHGEDKQGAQEFIEQHCRLDLDEDEYEEPYIVTVHKETETIVRIVADFSEDDVRYQKEMVQQPVMVEEPMQTTDQYGQPIIVSVPREQMQEVEVVTGILGINRGSYFIPYRFMPSLDGGFYGTGLGLLLGDISDTINTILNMLVDAGHMSSMGGGFIGSEFRIKGGANGFKPGEWKMTAERGAKVRESIVPMTFPGPDAVLFQMLGLLIDAGKEISSTKDIMTGDSGGKVQTATTTLALIEQGMMVFSAAYKRIFRSLKKEYRLIANINASGVSPEVYNAFHDDMDQEGQQVMHDPAQDFGAADMDVEPVADPNSVTKMQEMAKAQLIKEMAAEGLANPAAASERIFEAAQIGDTEDLVPQPDPQAQEMQQMQAMLSMKMMEADLTQKMVDIDESIARIEKTKTEAVKNMAGVEADNERLRLEAMQMMLKDRRDDIEQTLKAGLGRLAAESRNRGDTLRALGAASKANGSGQGGMAGGQPMVGSGALGASAAGGMA